MKNNAQWIVFEGLDKGGKTTLAKRLAESVPQAKYLKGICGATCLGKLTRRFPTTWLFVIEAFVSALRAITIRRQGCTVIQDRYIASVASHLPITKNFPNNVFIWIALKLFPKPDVLIYVIVKKEERIRRIQELGRNNPHEKWILENPEWIGKREEAYKKYFDSFLKRKIVIDTSCEALEKSRQKMLFFLM